MAHEIASTDCFYELNKDEKAWHGLGVRKDAITPEFLRSNEAGFVFDVAQESAQLADGTILDSVRVNRRVDNGQILAVVGPNTHAPSKGYTHLVDIAQPLVEAGAVEISTAGTLRDGKRGYVSMRFLLESFEADVKPGDSIVSFLMLKDVLDGSGSASGNLCNTRVVCANTLAVAEKEAEKFGKMRFNHTSTYVQTMADFMANVNVAKRQFELTVAQYRALAQKDINKADLAKYVTLCLDLPETTLPSESKALAKIIENFERPEVASTDGTWFKAYNAAQSFLQWQIGSKNTKQSTRTDSMLFGPSNGQNRAWLSNALQLSGVSA